MSTHINKYITSLKNKCGGNRQKIRIFLQIAYIYIYIYTHVCVYMCYFSLCTLISHFSPEDGSRVDGKYLGIVQLRPKIIPNNSVTEWDRG